MSCYPNGLLRRIAGGKINGKLEKGLSEGVYNNTKISSEFKTC